MQRRLFSPWSSKYIDISLRGFIFLLALQHKWDLASLFDLVLLKKEKQKNVKRESDFVCNVLLSLFLRLSAGGARDGARQRGGVAGRTAHAAAEGPARRHQGGIQCHQRLQLRAPLLPGQLPCSGAKCITH